MNEDQSSEQMTPHDKRMPIVRGTNFSQIYADAFYALPLSGGLDIAMLAATPLIDGNSFISVTDEDGTERMSSSDIKPRPSFTEVGRVRLDQGGFENILRVIVGYAGTSGLILPELLASLLETALTEAKNQDENDEA